MTKNKLEKRFSMSLKDEPRLWGMKLHNNPLSHQNTPGDYIITSFYGTDAFVYIIECKQVTCDEDSKGRLAHKRLKQMHDMLAFENKFPGFHKAFFCVAFYDKSWANSEVYMIPVKIMYDIVTNHRYESFNRDYMREEFQKYRMIGGMLPIWEATR